MIELQPDAYYESLNIARDRRFCGHGPCKSMRDGTLPAPTETTRPEPRIWPKPSTTAGRGPYRKKGRSGPDGICGKTGVIHQIMKNGFDKCGGRRIICRNCKATWKAAA